MPLLHQNDLAKELIRRRSHRPAPPPAPTDRKPLGEVSGNETTSYEMVERPMDEKRQKKSWLPSRRVGQNQDEGENRVVSEPVGMRGGMFGRLRLRRGSDGTAREGVGVFIESESSGVDVLDISSHGSDGVEHRDTHLVAPVSFTEHTDTSYNTSPSFIAFAPHTPFPSTTASSTHSLRPPPRFIRSPISKRTLAPTLHTPNRSIGRAAATRAVTLEARLADISISSSDLTASTCGSFKYPSQADIDTSDLGVRGILRPLNDRVPPNTPVPTVRFADSFLTPIKGKKRYGKTRSPVPRPAEGDILPAAQISGGPRWKRLGAILSAVDEDASYTPSRRLDSDKTEEAVSSCSMSVTASSSDSPICFARFDPSEVASSTPLPRRRPLDCSPPSIDSPYSSSRADSSITEANASAAENTTGSTGGEFGEEAIFEGCSALEALWEYGSSDGEDSPLDSPIRASPVTPNIEKAGIKEDSMVMINTAESEAVNWDGSVPGISGGNENRHVDSDPFPFASALKF